MQFVLQKAVEQIKETINPVARFCKVEHDELDTAGKELAELTAQLESLQGNIRHQLGIKEEVEKLGS